MLRVSIPGSGVVDLDYSVRGLLCCLNFKGLRVFPESPVFPSMYHGPLHGWNDGKNFSTLLVRDVQCLANDAALCLLIITRGVGAGHDEG